MSLRNNSEYVLPYFIENLEQIYRYIDYIDLCNICGKYQLHVYLNKYNWYIYNLFINQPNFNRIIIRNGQHCCVFTHPYKYTSYVAQLARCGIKAVDDYTAKLLYMQQKTLVTKRNQGYFLLVKL